EGGEEDRAQGGEEGILSLRAQLRRDLPDNSAPPRCGWRKGASILQKRGSDDQAAPESRGAGQGQENRGQGGLSRALIVPTLRRNRRRTNHTRKEQTDETQESLRGNSFGPADCQRRPFLVSGYGSGGS